MTDEVAAARAERDAIAEDLAELQAGFDLRWAADQRAIKRWQAAHPGKELVWPDHADLVVWLLGEREAYLQGLRNARNLMERTVRTLRERAPAAAASHITRWSQAAIEDIDEVLK